MLLAAKDRFAFELKVAAQIPVLWLLAAIISLQPSQLPRLLVRRGANVYTAPTGEPAWERSLLQTTATE